MFRTVQNIFILLLIGIIASGMPIYANNINISISSLFSLPNINKNIVIVTTEQNIISSNHVQIKFGFSPKFETDYFNFIFDELEPFTVELSSNNDTIHNLSLDDLIPLGNYKGMEFYDSDAVNYVAFEFEQEKLNLPDGSYNIKIIPNIQNKEIDLTECEFIINFNTEGDYAQTTRPIKGGETALTLYFPDNEFNYLIPITRIVRANAYPLTTTIRNIEQGPNKSLGLPTTSPIPIGSSAGKVSNVAHIRLPQNINEFSNGSTKTNIAINSIVNSLTSLNGISAVQFHLTGQYTNDPFHGLNISEPLFRIEEPQIFTAYITANNKFLLSPIPFSIFGTQLSDNNIETIFNFMKFKAIPEIYNVKRHPLVPNDIELLNYSLDSGVLTLIFNEQFTKAYKDNENRHKMMVDGIVLTFISLENINSVDIKINSNFGDGQLVDYNFDMPIYVNLEQ